MFKDYIYWIPLVIAWYTLYAYISYKHNLAGEYARFALILWIISAVSLWIPVSRHSTNILLDGMIFDTIIIVTYPVTMMLLGAGNLILINYVGFGFLAIGFIFLKLT